LLGTSVSGSACTPIRSGHRSRAARRQRGKCGIRRGVGRSPPRYAGIAQRPVCRRQISLLRRIEPPAAGRSVGTGWADDLDAAPSAGGYYGLDSGSNLRSAAPVETLTMGRRSIRRMQPRIARSMVPRAVPGSVCWKARPCSGSAATWPARCASRLA